MEPRWHILQHITLDGLDEIKRRELIIKEWLPCHTIMVAEAKLAFSDFRSKIPVFRLPGGFALDPFRALRALLATAVRQFPHAIMGMARLQLRMRPKTMGDLDGTTLRVPLTASIDARYKGAHYTMGNIVLKIPGLPMDSAFWHFVLWMFRGKVCTAVAPQCMSTHPHSLVFVVCACNRTPQVTSLSICLAESWNSSQRQ